MTTLRLIIIALMAAVTAYAQEPAKQVMRLTFDERITGDGQLVASPAAEEIPCQWGRIVGMLGELRTAAKGTPWKAEDRVEGRLGHAYAFGGQEASRYVLMRQTPETEIGTDDFTLTFWVRTGQPGGALFTATTSPPYWMLTMSADGSLRLMFRDDRPESKTCVAVSKSDLADGTWHHVAMAGDRDGALTFYVDGKLDNTGSIASNPGNLSKSALLGIGGTGSAQGYFIGALDDVRLYKGLLTPEQITALAAGE